MSVFFRRGARLAFGAAGLWAASCLPVAAAGSENIPTVAVVAFDYSDSSGEPRDQEADHARRVRAFRTQLRDLLVGDGRFRSAELPCLDRSACTARTTPPDELIAEAKAADADVLVFGSIHKMSTLVGGGRVGMVDVATGKILLDRVISFRGDNDEAFEKAAAFAARDIARSLAPGETTAEGTDRGIR